MEIRYKAVYTGPQKSVVSAGHEYVPDYFENESRAVVEHWVFHQEMVGIGPYLIHVVTETALETPNPPIEEA